MDCAGIGRLEEKELPPEGLLREEEKPLSELSEEELYLKRIEEMTYPEEHLLRAQGLFISCTNFRPIEVIDSLEKELRVPVVSSNTSTFWAMMREVGINKEIQGYGNLLSR